VDEAIHQAVGVAYKDCPTTWKALKQSILSDDGKRREFMSQVKAAL